MGLLELLDQDRLEELEHFLSERFAQNMEFFSHTSPRLFEALKQPRQDYNLLCNHKGINIINLHNSSLTYPEMESKYVMAEVHQEIAASPLNNPRWNLKGNEIELVPIDEKKLPITGAGVNKMIENLQYLGGKPHYHLGTNFFPSTAVYGLLGGLFLELLRERGAFFHSLFIFEENIDLFRISCYFVHYPALFDQVGPKALYLFVKEIIDPKILRHYFAARKISSNFMLLELQMYQSQKLDAARELLNQEFLSNKRGWGSFEDEMIGIANSLKNNQYKVLSYPKRINAPVCVIGNGPSLDSLLPFIKKMQDRMIIFSCGTALKVLKNYGIQPDFQIEIERIDYLKDVLCDAPLGDTTLLCGNMVNPSALALAKEGYIFLRGGSSSSYMFESSVIECAAPFVGNAGAALAMQMGSEVLLCGIDCGYIEGMSKHAQGSYYGDEGVDLPPNVHPVRANSNRAVYADSIFLLSRQNLETAIMLFKPKMVLNLGWGAFIQGSRSVSVDDFDLAKINKEKLLDEMKSYMKPALMKKINLAHVREYLNSIKMLLQRGVREKKELFMLIDEASALVASTSAKNPHLGILFEGSIAHLLQSLLLSILHLPHNQISTLYAQNIEIIMWTFDKMFFSYKVLLSLQEYR